MALFNISFGQKVQLYACTVSLISLLLTGMTFVAFDLKENRQSLVESLQMKADLLGNASFVALSMGDLSKANDVISIVSSDPFIIGVWIYSKEDKLILTYNPQSLGFKILPESLRLEGVYFEKGVVSVVRNIQSSNHLQGKVMVMSAIDKIEYRAITQTLILVIASVLSVITALLFSYRLRKSFTRPLHQLIQTVETITKNKDYGIRSEKVGDHDLDMLTSSFNDMLQVIQERNQIISKNEERLNLALWGSNEIMFDWDLARDNWYFDDSFESLFGYPRNEVPISKASYFKLIFEEDLALVEERLQKHLKGESPYFLEEHRIKNKSGNLLWVAVRSKVVERNMRGRAMRMAGTLMDITIRKQSEDRLKLYDKVFGTTTEGVMVTDQNFIIVEVNPAFSTITGYSREEILGQSMDMLHSDKHDDVFFRRMRFALQVKGYWQGELWEKRKNGEVYPQRLTINTMLDEKNHPNHFVAVFSDLTKFKQTEDEIRYLTHYDPLTSLPNRTLFMSQLEKTVNSAKKLGINTALILVGLDNFKIINDSYGHGIGDSLLQSVAKRLLKCINRPNLVSRITGDEFGLIIEEAQDRQALQLFARKVLEVLSATFDIKSQDIMLGASVGISRFPDDAQEVSELFLHADTALYHAKQAGRNCFKFYSPEMNDQMQARQRMEMLLRTALAHDEFTLLYQPKIDVKSAKICGVEALLRWHNSELGWVSPVEFISVAEESGIIVPLGYWVLKSACNQITKWHEMGYTDLQVSVNLSAYQFRAGDIVEDIAKIIWESKTPPESLDLELTESVLMDNAQRCKLMLEVLRTMGMTITIDDFGTGYSSLSYLRRFPIDGLKIDGSFIRNISVNPEDASIVKAIVSMAKSLKLRITAEGVETIEQVKFLLDQEVEEFQGFYFSKPVTVEEVTQLLEENKTKPISFS